MQSLGLQTHQIPFLFYSTLLYIFMHNNITPLDLSCLYAGADRPHTPVYWFLRRRPPTRTFENEEPLPKSQYHKPQYKPSCQGPPNTGNSIAFCTPVIICHICIRCSSSCSWKVYYRIISIISYCTLILS